MATKRVAKNQLASAIVDIHDMTANMYGCQPCPKCGSMYRCMFNDKPGVIQCDQCGHNEVAVVKEF